MTDLLLRLFVNKKDDPSEPEFRAAVGSLSGTVGIVCNLLLFAGKLLVGMFAASVSITGAAASSAAASGFTCCSAAFVREVFFLLEDVRLLRDDVVGTAGWFGTMASSVNRMAGCLENSPRPLAFQKRMMASKSVSLLTMT